MTKGLGVDPVSAELCILAYEEPSQPGKPRS